MIPDVRVYKRENLQTGEMLANIYGYAEENGTIVFNVPEEVNKSGNLIRLV